MFCSECGKSQLSNELFCTKCGNKLEAELTAPEADSNSNPSLNPFKFYKIGTFLNSNGNVDRTTEPGILLTKRLPIVYSLTINQKVMYVGESVQGYRRPLNYHKNEVMHKVYKGLRDSVLQGQNVEVFARSRDLEMQFEGLNINLRVSLEMALIKLFSPPWNNKIDD